MKHGKLCISGPDMKLHKDFCPVIRKNHSFWESISVLMARNLSFAKRIIDKYSGQFFYDFDFGSFVFLTRLMQGQAGEQKPGDTADVPVKDSRKQWRFLEKQPVNMLYITTPQFQKTVRHLTVENKIFPAKTRLAADFYRQTLVWERIREFLRDEKIPVVNYSDVQAMRQESSGEKNLPELSVVQQSAQPGQGGRQSFEKLIRNQETRPEAVRVLEDLIEKKEVFGKIYEKVNMELHKHNFKNFEDEKLCFLGVIKTFEKNNKENKGITDLLYRIDSASEPQLESIKAELMEAGQSAKRLGKLKAYLEEKSDLTAKISVSEVLLEFMYTADGRQLSERLRRYNHVLRRHTVIEAALENYRQLLAAHSEIDFTQKKIQLLNMLAECRTQNQRLFTEFLDVEKILAQIPKQLFDAGILPKIPVAAASFDTLSEHIIKKIESADVDVWRQMIQERPIMAEAEPVWAQGERAYPSATVSEMWTERVDKTMELLTVLSTLRTNVDDLRKVIPGEKEEFEEFFNVPGLDGSDRRYIRKLLRMVFEEGTIAKEYMAAVQETEISGVIEKLYETAQRVKMRNQMRSCLGIVMVREFLENLRAAAGEIQGMLALEEAHREVIEKHINDIVKTDVEPVLAAEDDLSETDNAYNERRLFRQWFFEIHQWQERRVALAQIYETLNREYGAQIFNEETVKTEEIKKRKAYFLDMIRTHQERHSAVWHTEALMAMRQFTLNTKLGRQMMKIFSLNRHDMESLMTDIFSKQVQENIQKMEHLQWLELWKILSTEYADSEKFAAQRTSMEETFRMLEAAQEIYAIFERKIESQKNTGQPPQIQGANASALPQSAPGTAQQATIQGVPEGDFLLSAPQLFASTARNYLKTHSEIEKLRSITQMFSEEGFREIENYTETQWEEFFSHVEKVYLMPQAEGSVKQHEAQGMAAAADIKITGEKMSSAETIVQQRQEAVREIYAIFERKIESQKNAGQPPQIQGANASALPQSAPGTAQQATIQGVPEGDFLLSAPQLFASTARNYLKTHSEIEKLRSITQMFSEEGLREIENYTETQWEEFFSHVEKVYLMPQAEGSVKQHEAQGMAEAADIKTTGEKIASAETIVQQRQEAVREIYKTFLETVEKERMSSRVTVQDAQGTGQPTEIQSVPQLFASTARNYLKTHSEIEKLRSITQMFSEEGLREIENYTETQWEEFFSHVEKVYLMPQAEGSVKQHEAQGMAEAADIKATGAEMSSAETIVQQRQEAVREIYKTFLETVEKERMSGRVTVQDAQGTEQLTEIQSMPQLFASTARNYLKTHSEIEKLRSITQMFSEEGLRKIENYTDLQWAQFADSFKEIQQIWKNTSYDGTETGMVYRKDIAKGEREMSQRLTGPTEAAEAAEKSELPVYSRILLKLQKAQTEPQSRQVPGVSEFEMREIPEMHEIRDIRDVRVYKDIQDIKDVRKKRSFTLNEAAYRQTKLQKETISRLEKIIEEQKVQVAQLLKNQEEAKTRAAKRQKAETQVSESEMFGRFMGQFQEELRMERMRRRL